MHLSCHPKLRLALAACILAIVFAPIGSKAVNHFPAFFGIANNGLFAIRYSLFANPKILCCGLDFGNPREIPSKLPAQNSQPSPTPTVQPTPTPSATPLLPVRTPSPTPLPGAQNFHQWGSITVFNGLPSDSVRAVAQTLDGVMWFGTDNGLARFDGRRVQNYSLGGTETDRVTVLETASSGELWIGTRAGAFVYSDNRFQPVEGTQNIGVTAILLEPEIYLATDAGLVFRVTRREGGTYAAENLFPEAIRTDDGGVLAITSLVEIDGRLLAGTSGRGVFLVKENSASEFPTAPRPIFVNSLARGDAGKIWFGSDAAKGVTGIYLVEDGSRARRITAPTANVLALEANESGLWAGTERYGLFHVTGDKLKKNYTFENTSGGLRSNTIYTLFTDREGVIWIGTNRGVSRFDRLGPFQQTVSDIPNSNFIRTLFRASDGKIYAGSNRGLFVQSDDKWVPVPAYANKPIFALSEDKTGKLLVGTSEKELFSFDAQSLKLASPDALKSGAIWRVFRAADGAVWIAGEHGVFRVRDGQPEKIIEVEDVRDVFVDHNEHVWAATTTRGLLHARRDERFGWLVSSVGFEQGLPSEKAFSVLPLEDGLLIATNRGVVTYKPGTTAPKLIATRVLSQRTHDLSEARSQINLEYPQNSLLVEVAGQSSRTFPEEFQYAFFLKNAKGEILDSRISNDPQYAPADLKAGGYTVEAIAFDRDLLSSEPLTISFSVARAPFPWTATALGVLLAIALIALIWAVIERRRIVLRNRELAAARFDLAHEAERERSRIARDLHDQTLADLRDLMMKSDRQLPPGSGFREDIEEISTEIRRICEDLSPSVLENVGFIASLEFLLGHTVENYKFDAGKTVDEDITFPRNVQLQIYRITQEVLTNIKRHADAELVEMRVSTPESSSFELTITNDGKPFTPPNNSIKDGRGIAGIRSRAALIHATVEWDQTLDAKPRFCLTLKP